MRSVFQKNLPGIAVRDDGDLTADWRNQIETMMPQDPIGAESTNILIIPHIVHEHLLRGSNIRLVDVEVGRAGDGPGRLDDFFELSHRIPEIDRRRSTGEEEAEIVNDESGTRHVWWSQICMTLLGMRRSVRIAPVERDGHAQRGDDGYRRSSPHLHGMDGVPGMLHGLDVYEYLFVGQPELVEDLELAALIFDCLEHHAGLAKEPRSCQKLILYEIWKFEILNTSMF